MGGGVMRTVAKAAAVGGYRAAHAPWLDQAAAAAAGAAGRSSRPAPASVSVSGPAGEGAPSLTAQSATGDAGAAVEQRTSWKMDDWELAGGKEEDLFDALHPAPARLVFGPVPTLQEAKEATSDLKDALEMLYLSPNVTGLEDSVVAARSTSYESRCLENLDPENRDVAILPSTDRHVVQAFSLLQGSPEAQDIVASLASDKNVWDAVMKNERVMEFYRTHQINVLPAETVESADESVIEDGMSSESSVQASASSGNGLMDFMHSVKVKVTELVDSLSDFLKDVMGKTGGGQSTTRPATGEGSYVDMAMGGASFLVLAIAAILVILLKRG